MKFSFYPQMLTLAFYAMLSTGSANAKDLTGTVKIDGSSTVFPISEAMAEEFQKLQPKVRITVGVSGTGGGFKKFGAGETDISNASRPIKQEEADKAAASKIEFIELPVAYDGLTVLVNPKNNWVSSLTIAQLKALWSPGSKINTWKDINPKWPARKIKLYGPGPDSGTFDYFTEEVVGKAKVSRSDFTASEDDNVLVRGISQDLDALGYFGYAYYEENQGKLKALPIDGGKGTVEPSAKTIEDSTYPLSRPIFIYVSKKSADRPEVEKFVEFYLEKASKLVRQVGYVPLPSTMYKTHLETFKARTTGSRYGGKQAHNATEPKKKA